MSGTGQLANEFRTLPNLYEYMGVLPGVDESSLKKAFKNLTLKYHPDLNADAGAGRL